MGGFSQEQRVQESVKIARASQSPFLLVDESGVVVEEANLPVGQTATGKPWDDWLRVNKVVVSKQIAVEQTGFRLVFLEFDPRSDGQRVANYQHCLRQAEELAEIGCFEWDVQENLVSWTDGLYKIFGLQPGEFPATFEGFLERVIPEDRKRVQVTIEQALESGGPFASIEQIRRHDGQIRFLESRGQVMTDAHGNAVRLVGVCRDITERREQEKASQWQIDGLNMLAESARDVLSSGDREEWVALFRRIADHLDCQNFANYVFEDGTLNLWACHGYPDVVIENYGCLKPGQALCGMCAATREMVYMPLTELENSEAGRPFLQLGVRAYVGVPLMSKQRLLGTICFTSTTRDHFEDHQLDFMKTVSELVAAAQARVYYEREIRQSEKRFRSLAENMADALILFDVEGTICDVNPQAGVLLGYGRDELLGADLRKAKFSGGQDWVAMASRLTAGGTQLFEDQLQNRDRSTVPVEVRLRRVVDQDLDLILASVLDLTDRREIERQKLVAEETSGMILQRAQMVAWEFEPEQKVFRMINGPCEELLGLQRDSWLQAGFIHETTHPDDLEELLRQLTCPTEKFELTVRMRHRDQQYRCIELRAGATVDEKGELLVRGLMTDVTERKQLEDQLRHSQKMEAIGRLAGGIAHDFNNLLTVINTYAELVEMRIESAEDNIEAIKAIQDAASRAHGLTSQLLMFARNAPNNKQVLNLNSSLEKATNLLQRLVEENIEISTDLAPGLFNIKIDPSYLDQVIFNLAVNARDAMPEGGHLHFETRMVHLDPPEAAALELPNAGEYVQLVVTDTGCGMSEAVKTMIFEPFFTTKRDGKGSGLGLAVVYAVVQESGASIEVDSQPGAGSRFKILFPTTQHSVRSLDSRVPKAAGRGNERILLVEDEELVRRSTSEALRLHGFEVLEARSAEQARKLADLAAGQLDLLLTDMVMPDANGLDLAESIRDQYPQIRVVCMSGHSDDITRRIDGPNVFLRKPFRLYELVTRVRQVLDGEQHD